MDQTSDLQCSVFSLSKTISADPPQGQLGSHRGSHRASLRLADPTRTRLALGDRAESIPCIPWASIPWRTLSPGVPCAPPGWPWGTAPQPGCPPQPQGQPWDGAVSVTHRAVTAGTQAGLGDLSGSPWEWSSSGNLRECLVCVLEKQTPVLWSCRGECAQTSSSEQSQSNRQDSGEPCSIPAGLLHPQQQE